MTEDRDEIYVPSGAFTAWLHPVKCFRTLLTVSERMRLIEDERTMRQRDVDAIMERLTESNRLLEAARAETASLRVDLAARGNALAEAEAKVRQLTNELEETRGLESQLEEFQRELGQVEDLKRRYERRIEMLRAKIRELDDKARIDDELAIDMTARRIPTIPASPKAPGVIVGSATVELHDPAVPKVQGTPVHPQLPPPDLNWLQDLDPEL